MSHKPVNAPCATGWLAHRGLACSAKGSGHPLRHSGAQKPRSSRGVRVMSRGSLSKRAGSTNAVFWAMLGSPLSLIHSARTAQDQGRYNGVRDVFHCPQMSRGVVSGIGGLGKRETSVGLARTGSNGRVITDTGRLKTARPETGMTRPRSVVRWYNQGLDELTNSR